MDAALDSAGNGTLESQLAAPPSLVMLVTQELRKRVLRGEYAPGQRLSEVQLSRELGVSRPPLREAMRLLQQEGLLSLQPRRGTFVAPLTAEDVREIYSLRAALEALAVDLALPLSAPEQLQPL